jgi:ABC-type dipeptide/oligopeptide/nickel transport system permease subunit
MATLDRPVTSKKRGIVRWGLHRQRRNEALWGILCVAPAVLGFLLWQLGPIVASLFVAFTDWRIAGTPNWVGLENFQQLFTADRFFYQSLRVTTIYTLGSVPLSLIFAFFLAMLLNQKIDQLGREILERRSVEDGGRSQAWWPRLHTFSIGLEGSLLNSLHHLILPASVLGLSQAAPLIRYIRSSMLEVIRQDYVRVAQAKGLRYWIVIYRHALRNAMIPIVTIIALQLPILFSGTVIIEQIFSWPGMGALTITAILSRDYPTVMAITLISGFIVVLFNLIADILYVLIDPRIKYS